MLYLISLGLYDEKDMSLRALEVAKKCDLLYAEFYTTKMATDVKKISHLVNKPVRELSRKDMEEGMAKILEKAAGSDVGIFVGGDVLTATTHLGLVMETKKLGIRTKLVHGSSVLTAVAETGLSLYKFGMTTTVVYPEKGYAPTSCYEAIKKNKKMGLHTLVLLDVKPPRHMSAREGILFLLEIESVKKEGVVKPSSTVLAACGLGGTKPVIKISSVRKLVKDKALDKVPAVLIFPGKLHFIEKEFLEML